MSQSIQSERVFSGSYDPADVHILLKPTLVPMVDVESKEVLIQSGIRHYSEMLSQEGVPDRRYIRLYEEALDRNAGVLRGDIETLAELIAARPETSVSCVLVSLARAGTPVGVLLKRALSRLGLDCHHYSISIIRGRGIDQKALRHIHDRHGSRTSIFVDGWTGKGAIKSELERSLAANPLGFNPFLAVVADPAGRADVAATTDDYVIPSGLLNGIVSGLISRSVLNADLVGPDDFHACVHQVDRLAHDRTRDFIASVESAIPYRRLEGRWSTGAAHGASVRSRALVVGVATERRVSDLNRIKPGIAEATRAVLRRVPECIMVRDVTDPEVAHLLHLGGLADVPVLERDLGDYRALTVIKTLGGEQE
ncbi:cysteine protease StiP domain-containing protein [Sphingomonas sp.]|uniref:cysteine protease StiP domain-containing protein n=1 Tax=Sphingomonas sp. TaxID=28214 RepID=UPI0025EFD57E|nr:cysteine protease StiP domain-containing protein [Sphingomonas sp.]